MKCPRCAGLTERTTVAHRSTPTWDYPPFYPAVRCYHCGWYGWPRRGKVRKLPDVRKVQYSITDYDFGEVTNE